MARLAIAGIIASLTLIPAAAMAQMDPRVGAPPMPPVGTPMPHAMPPVPHPMPPMVQPLPGQPMPNAAPPAAVAYVAPSYGYTLPRQWIAPSHYIQDYRSYGLPAPAWGYGWSRYHDDVVLTDRWGRVYDWRDGRDLRSGGRDGRLRKRDRSGIVGAIVGGAIGALTGNLIAGAGSRLAGSLIGGGVGALAGQAIDSGKIGGDDGSWHGDYYGGGYRPQGPHWFMGDYNGGYSCGCGQTITTTTTYAQPIVTRKVTYVTEYVRVPVKQRVRHTPVRTKERYLGGS